MPKIASLYIKTSIWFFATGIFTGLHMATAHHFGMGEMHAYYVPAHTHIVLVGGLVMCGMGFALWLLPTASPMSPFRGNLARTIYWLLTLGTIVRFVAETTLGYMMSEVWLRYVVLAGMTAQSFALLAFCWHVWPRLREPSE